MGATTYLEVVSTHRDQALVSVRTATELRVDWLMGGTWIKESRNLLHGASIGYLPFTGEPVGHPTRLAGAPDRIADDCRRAEAARCAGSITNTNTDQIQALAAAGADAFTIGSAAFDGSLQPHAGHSPLPTGPRSGPVARAAPGNPEAAARSGPRVCGGTAFAIRGEAASASARGEERAR
ncbi:hypothetical protein ACFYMI_35395 [Streptomyces collinus]|uniref:hypothetical protein n=1 Tax=Streptomyces collinus TaxID=42684 RepID=UPI0036C2F563